MIKAFRTESAVRATRGSPCLGSPTPQAQQQPIEDEGAADPDSKEYKQKSAFWEVQKARDFKVPTAKSDAVGSLWQRALD